MNQSPTNFIRSMKKQGRVLKRTTGSHHIFFHADKQKTVPIPVHTKDIPLGLFYALLKQTGMTIKDI